MRVIKNLDKIHNLAMNCESISELDQYLESLGYTIGTSLAGKHSPLPIYYFQKSKASGKMQDRHGNWYTPEK